MTVKSTWRGHKIECRNGKWYFCDNGGLVEDDPDRMCGYCNLPSRKDGHDACLGELEGVMNACCGHGVKADAYTQLMDGEINEETSDK